MFDWKSLKETSLSCRQAIAGLLRGESERADIIPPTWNNNLHWHAGHLVTTPHLLTYGVLGEPIRIPTDYRKWFAKGTSPAAWGDDPVPPFESLVAQLVDVVPTIFEELETRADERFARAYTTSLGIELRTPAESLLFSMIHDGIHIGMIQTLKRGLNAM
jgi:hypothetical protein